MSRFRRAPEVYFKGQRVTSTGRRFLDEEVCRGVNDPPSLLQLRRPTGDVQYEVNCQVVSKDEYDDVMRQLHWCTHTDPDRSGQCIWCGLPEEEW